MRMRGIEKNEQKIERERERKKKKDEGSWGSDANGDGINV